MPSQYAEPCIGSSSGPLWEPKGQMNTLIYWLVHGKLIFGWSSPGHSSCGCVEGVWRQVSVVVVSWTVEERGERYGSSKGVHGHTSWYIIEVCMYVSCIVTIITACCYSVRYIPAIDGGWTECLWSASYPHPLPVSFCHWCNWEHESKGLRTLLQDGCVPHAPYSTCINITPLTLAVCISLV